MNSAWLLVEGGSASFNDEDPGRSATLPWVVPRPGVYGQHKLDSRDYVLIRTGSWWGRVERCGVWVTQELRGGTVVNMTKIHCMKSSKN